MHRFRDPVVWAGFLLAIVSFFVYWLSNRAFDAARGDLFYLADAFLHGKTNIAVALGPFDVIYFNGLIYVPFAPFPALVLAPIVALTGPVTADQWETGINAFLAAFGVLCAWWVAGRIGAGRIRDRLALALLLGFSTQVWWVTTRGGVWHTGHLVAIILTLFLIAELFGKRRPLLLGLLIGAAFLTRAPIAFATPAVALWLVASWPDVVGRGRTLRRAGRRRSHGAGGCSWPSASCHRSRSSSGTTSTASATRSSPATPSRRCPSGSRRIRQQGLFSTSHVAMNLEYLFWKTPALTAAFPYFRPDGLGMSVFITSPALLLAVLAPWRDRRSWLLLFAAVAVLIPTLLYYGGGWLQYGYRYFLDSIPFVWALVAMGIAYRGSLRWWGWLLIGWGILIGLGGVYWAYHL